MQRAEWNKKIARGFKKHQRCPTKIRLVRETANLSQEKVAEKIGCSFSWYTRFENGHLTADRAKAAKLAKLFKASIDDFFESARAGRFQVKHAHTEQAPKKRVNA